MNYKWSTHCTSMLDMTIMTSCDNYGIIFLTEKNGCAILNKREVKSGNKIITRANLWKCKDAKQEV